MDSFENKYEDGIETSSKIEQINKKLVEDLIKGTTDCTITGSTEEKRWELMRHYDGLEFIDELNHRLTSKGYELVILSKQELDKDDCPATQRSRGPATYAALKKNGQIIRYVGIGPYKTPLWNASNSL